MAAVTNSALNRAELGWIGRGLPLAIAGVLPLVGYWAVTRSGQISPDTALIGATLTVIVVTLLIGLARPNTDNAPLVSEYQKFARRVSAGLRQNRDQDHHSNRLESRQAG